MARAQYKRYGTDGSFDVCFSANMTVDNDESVLAGKVSEFETVRIHRLFEDFLEKNSEAVEDRIALEEYATRQTFTYSELNKTANRLARVFLKKVNKAIEQGRSKPSASGGDFIVALR